MKNNEQGAILITVAVITMIMMILVVSVISLNVSQIKANRHQAQRIKAEQIAKQIFWQNYSSLSSGNGPLPLNTPTDIQILINGGPKFETYTWTLTEIGPDANGIFTYPIRVDYPQQ